MREFYSENIEYRRWHDDWLSYTDNLVENGSNDGFSDIKMAIQELFMGYDEYCNVFASGGVLEDIVDLYDVEENSEQETSEELWRKLRGVSVNGEGDRSKLQLSNTGGDDKDNQALAEQLGLLIERGRLYELAQQAVEIRRNHLKNFEVLRDAFGNKCANLITTEQMVGVLNSTVGTEAYNVPHFCGIGTDVYKKWKETGELDLLETTLGNFAEYVRDGPVWVRSSAVYSEDGEHTGAGIYESVKLKQFAAIEDFKAAIVKVYTSVDSERAMAYREYIGVHGEQMGIVVQQDVGYLERATWGYGNSTMPGLADRLQVSAENIIVPIEFSKPKVVDYISKGMVADYFGAIWANGFGDETLWFIPDTNKVHSTEYAKMMSYPLVLAEMIYQQPVQQEYSVGGRFMQAGCSVLQTRPLPEAAYGTLKQFDGFPHNIPLLFEGRAIDVVNGQEAILVSFDEESTIDELIRSGEGYVLYADTNFTRSMQLLAEKELDRVRNAHCVVVGQAAHTALGASGGHFETLCIEFGVPCVFADPNGMSGEALEEYLKESNARVKVYSDGSTGRVYSGE